jgi:hypothetical protein
MAPEQVRIRRVAQNDFKPTPNIQIECIDMRSDNATKFEVFEQRSPTEFERNDRDFESLTFVEMKIFLVPWEPVKRTKHKVLRKSAVAQLSSKKDNL